jgi:hypothetical protein
VTCCGWLFRCTCTQEIIASFAFDSGAFQNKNESKAQIPLGAFPRPLRVGERAIDNDRGQYAPRYEVERGWG